MAGRTDREGISLLQLTEMFPDERAAQKWFEARIWPNGCHCPKCGSERTSGSTHKTMPYWCTDCRSYFSVKTGTLMEESKLPLRKWVFAIYLELTSLKGVSSLKLHRDIGVHQETAWFLLHRIRAAFRSDDQEPPFEGPVEFDETYVDGKEKIQAREQAVGERGDEREDGRDRRPRPGDRPGQRPGSTELWPGDDADVRHAARHGRRDDLHGRARQLPGHPRLPARGRQPRAGRIC